MTTLGVLTTYEQAGRRYGSYILCPDLATARALLDARNLNERIESTLMPVEPMPAYHELTDAAFVAQLPQVLHTATFWGYLALRARTLSVDEVLGDEGVVHELTHLLAQTTQANASFVGEVRTKLALLRDKTVGLFPAQLPR